MGDSDSDSQHLDRSTARQPSSSNKRKRTSRATSSQIEALLTHLEAQPFLASKRFPFYQGNEKFESGWKELAAMLNAFPNGSVKQPEQWMTVWRDIKSRACIKAAKLNKEKIQAGNKHVNYANLSDLEKRIVTLVCSDYVVDTNANCSNGIPDEDMLQLELEYLEVPQSNEEEMINNSNYPLSSVSIAHVYPVLSPMEQSISNGKTEITNGCVSQPVITVGSSAVTSTALTPQTKNEDTQTNDPDHAYCRRRVHRNGRRSTSEQNSVRTHFLAVAKSNAESMKMLAAATNLQAEAAKIQAEAAKSQAATAKIQAEALLRFADATNKIGDALLLLAKKQ